MREILAEKENIYWIAQKLRSLYGSKRFQTKRPVIKMLVQTLLSQNTTDRNRDRAYQALMRKFHTFEGVLKADESEIAEAIKPAGLHNQKANRLKRILERIKEERGELNLDWLCELDTESARKYLRRFPGIGEKTIACVLLFSCIKPVFPVDTHILRVTKRLGLISEKTNANKAHELLAKKVPQDLFYEFHLNLIEHGRKICKARKPDCKGCPLNKRCLFHKKEGKRWVQEIKFGLG